jgi:hypothetical protein
MDLKLSWKEIPQGIPQFIWMRIELFWFGILSVCGHEKINRDCSSCSSALFIHTQFLVDSKMGLLLHTHIKVF